MWWYSPPGSTVAFNVLGGAQREFSHSPPLSTNRTRKGRSLNDAKQDVAMASSPTSPTNPRNQERRSYHPNPPAHRSEWVMWAGNVPSDVTEDELRDFFNQLPEDKEQIYGGVSTVFLISRSNCAFVNFDSQAQLEAATARFNGQSIRPDDQRCPRLVCRVRRREDDLMAGVGAQRGSGMHIKWVKEQRARVRREQADKVGSPKDMEGHISTCPNLSRSPSIASTNSDILTRYFPQRYFILKSLTQSDLDRSVHKNIWATQRHNEEILDQAYRTSEDVFLIFSVNKSGEFSDTPGPVLRDESGTHWASATGFTPPPSSESSSSEISAGSSPSPDHTGAERQDSLYIFPLDEHRVKKAPQSAPAGRPSFPLIESHRPHYRLAHSMPNATMSPPLPLRHHRPSSIRSASHSSVERDAVPGPHEVPEADIEDRPKPGSDVPFESRDTREDGTGSTWDRPFRVEWIRRIPCHSFVSRDGTELEPTIGRLLLDEWDRSSVARRRGQRPKHQN
ncbi:YT521-B-like domain-containing protein [Lactarius quietus]|nr:YT521-B-like domain-containing protein [Lactarius quietus]